MSVFSDALDRVFDGLVRQFGGQAVTYAQGSNSKSIASTACVRKDLRRGGSDGLDPDTCTFLVKATEFASGFSGTNPVLPSARDSVTVSGEKAWEVDPSDPQAVQLVNGGVYVIRASRRRQAGDA